MRTTEEKYTVMDIVSWKPREEVTFPVHNGLCFVVVVVVQCRPIYKILNQFFGVSGPNKLSNFGN
ncbi:hypothetical protein RHMOL_Rhmol06G0240200 [Rhododendron molle]|uniref:Uncharacterized protein n=1 Tax=Rhododendron molle TaxID=49168 RepID=A0ACC0NGB8_RHOML|nr:hypothetical protein RHMOL_Rhmol06G0240200 [Rhododendron molle]